jgi:hypothetical protein
MVRLAGASALALTVMAAAAPSAQAAHRHHYSATAGYHHYSGAHHYRVHYAYGRHGTRVARGSEMADRGTGFDQDGRHGFRQEYGAYASVDPRGSRVSSSSRVSGGRPRAWCGWYARGLVGSDPGVAYNLARNWAHWGRAASPGPGVIVVWSHHVGMITGQAPNGQWIVKSGNDGGGVARERVRSISGAIAFRAG